MSRSRGAAARRSWRALVVAAALGACTETRPWHEAGAYRWRDLDVPRRGGDGFEVLRSSETGITFANRLTEAQILENEHVLNGSGVAIGDVDGDGRPDLYFARLDGPNVLYRNLGGWRFEDVTEAAGVAAPGRFSTGAALADVDGDGDLDLLVTSLGGPNSVFLNDGTGRFAEAQDAGLEGGMGSTTVALADVDGDGDLDLYLANYKPKSVRDLYPPGELAFDSVVREREGRYQVVPKFREHYGVRVQRTRVMRFELGEPDRFYRNDGGRFVAVPFTGGAFLDEDGRRLQEPFRDWGLAARFHDVNGDGLPDLYVCNDFESPDRLWINQGGGRFRLADRVALRTISQSSMAVDFSDVDRDGEVDFVVADMLDPSTRRQKTQTPPTAPEQAVLGDLSQRIQQPHNTFLLNRGDGTFAELGQFAGIGATGWSWNVLFLDVDLDGFEDLLVANGHAYDYLDSDTQVRSRGLAGGADWRRSRLLFPPLPLPNQAFRNRGDLTFERMPNGWGFGGEDDVAHGMAAGDLDGDGDLDLVANRLGAAAGLYRNRSAGSRVAVRLAGAAPNTAGVGATIYLMGGPVPVQSKEVTLAGMYLSSSEPLATFAAGQRDRLRIAVRWRGGRWSLVPDARRNRLYEIAETGAVPRDEVPDSLLPPSRAPAPAPAPLFESAPLAHPHHEAPYDDFGRQPLLPRRLSESGPGVSWADLDGDGDEDLFVTTGRGGTPALFRNDDGRLVLVTLNMPPAPLDLTTALPLPDGAPGVALLVGQMNYEAQSPAAASGAPSVLRFRLNPLAGVRGVAPRIDGAIPGEPSGTGPLSLADYDGDGDLDVFVGGRVLPARYPGPATSRLFRNHAGRLVLDTLNAPALAHIGLVSAALFTDVDGDGDADLALATEWGPVRLLVNDGGRFTDATAAWGLADRTSWWNGLAAGDLDGDGRMDLVATSWGRNLRATTSPEHPLTVFYGDVDGNGVTEVIEARYDPRLAGLAPVKSRSRLVNALPALASRIPSFAVYAEQTVADIFGPALARAPSLSVTTLDHTLWLNRGGRFEPVPLPPPAQWAPAFAAVVADFDGDGREDLFLSQNFFPTDDETPRYDAGRGLLLLGDGAGGFVALPGDRSGITLYGDQRGAAAADYDADGRVDLVVSQNAAPTVLLHNRRARPGLRVRLVGPPGNPAAIGAAVRLVYGELRGPLREIQAGSGYWSLNGAVQVLGKAAEPTAVWVRWPDGSQRTVPITPGLEVTVTWE